MSEQSSLPSRPKEGEPQEAAPSKNALKKLQKEKEKAEKAALREQKEREEREERERVAEANDTSKHLYGAPPSTFPTPTGNLLATLQQVEAAEESSRVTLVATVQSARKQGATLAFLVLGKYKQTIQAVVTAGGEQGISKPMVKWCQAINTESIVRVTAQVRAPAVEIKSDLITLKKYELHVEQIHMIDEAPEQLPIQVKDCNQPPPEEEEGEESEAKESEKSNINVSLKARLDNRVLSLRAPSTQAILEIQGAVTLLFQEYMDKHSFTPIQPSYVAGAATEGGAGVFEITYFKTKAYLTQSPQFFKQMAIAGGLRRFTGLDFEMEIQQHYHEVLSFGEELIHFIIHALQTRPKFQELVNIIRKAGYTEAGNFRLPPNGKAVRITFAEAKQLLKESGYPIDEDPHADIGTSEEKALGEIMLKKHNTDFYSVDKYPRSLRPFYTKPCPDNPELTNSYDFFMRGQEIMSGAQRINNHQELCANMSRLGLEPQSEGFIHYTDSFKYGCMPHGGGGFGLNRIVQYFLGLHNVREATMFPRDPGRLAP
ncbi:hypothetical protein P7C71_g3817, partial [Lecanoromycetidae sp. Uapishka_2]